MIKQTKQTRQTSQKKKKRDGETEGQRQTDRQRKTNIHTVHKTIYRVSEPNPYPILKKKN